MKTTLENNSTIAEFLDIEFDETGYINNPNSKHYKRNCSFITHRMELSELMFHSDWNWLMEVVEKIESLEFDFTIYTGSSVSIINTKDFPFEEVLSLSGSSKIEAVYNAVVSFIEWYNSAEKENNNQKVQDSIDIDSWSK